MKLIKLVVLSLLLASTTPAQANEWLRCGKQEYARTQKSTYITNPIIVGVTISAVTGVWLIAGVIIAAKAAKNAIATKQENQSDAIYSYLRQGTYSTGSRFEKRLHSYLKAHLIAPDDAALAADAWSAADKMDENGRVCPNERSLVGPSEFRKRVLVTLLENGYEPKNDQVRKTEHAKKLVYEHYEIEDAAMAGEVTLIPATTDGEVKP